MDDLISRLRQRDEISKTNQSFNELCQTSNEILFELLELKDKTRFEDKLKQEIVPYQEAEDVNALKADIKRLSKEHKDTVKKLKDIESQIKELIDFVEIKSTEISSLLLKNSKLQKEYDELQENLNSANAILSNLSNSIVYKIKTKDSLITQLYDYENTLQKCKNSMQSINNRIELLKKKSYSSLLVRSFQIPNQSNDFPANLKSHRSKKRKTYDIYNYMSSSTDQCTNKFNFTNQIYSIDFSPSNPYAAIGGADRCVHIIRLDKMEISANYYTAKNGIMAVNYSPTGSKLLSASFDHNISIYEGTGSSMLFSTSLHQDAINDAIFTSDYALCSAGRDCMIYNFDINKKATKASLRCQSTPQSLNLQMEGNLLLCGHRDGKLRYWDMFSDKCAIEIQACRSEIVQVLSNEPENLVFTISRAKNISSFDKRMPERKLIQQTIPNLMIYDHLQAAVYKNNIYIGGQNKTLKILDQNTLKETKPFNSDHEADICAVSVHPILGTIITGDVSGGVCVWS